MKVNLYVTILKIQKQEKTDLDLPNPNLELLRILQSCYRLAP